jgi:hypothetical protein
MPNRLIDGWDNRIERTGVYKPIVAILATAMVAFIFYQIGENYWVNLLSLLIIAFAFIQGALVIGALTEDWKWRIAGLLVAVGGTGLAYLFLAGNAANYTNINTLAIRSTIRSSLFTGSIILILGTWSYLWYRRRGLREPFLDPRDHYRSWTYLWHWLFWSQHLS